jgi:hypothetical protein
LKNTRSSGVQEFRSSGVQEFRSSGVQEFRSSGVQEFRRRWEDSGFVELITISLNLLPWRVTPNSASPILNS